MIRLNIHEAKTHLSRYLAKLREGECIILCRRNVPIAEIRSLARKKYKPRIGVFKGQFTVPDSFFEPLPEEVAPSE